MSSALMTMFLNVDRRRLAAKSTPPATFATLPMRFVRERLYITSS